MQTFPMLAHFIIPYKKKTTYIDITTTNPKKSLSNRKLMLTIKEYNNEYNFSKILICLEVGILSLATDTISDFLALMGSLFIF